MGVSRLYKVGSPYNAAELAEIDFEQSTDTMYIAHIDHAPTKLVRSGHTSWAFVEVVFGPTVAVPASVTGSATVANTDVENDGAAYFPQPSSYVVTAYVDSTGQESRASAEVTLTNDLQLRRNYNTVTWSAVTGADRYRVYKAENSQNFGYIGTTEELTFRDDNIGPAYDESPPIGDNPFAAAGDYPQTFTFFEQRAIWAGTRNKPNGVWGSRSADFENMDFSRPLRSTDALSFALVAGRVNTVNQLVSVTDLLALTSDSIFKVSGGSGEDYLTATQVRARRQVGRGSSRLSPLVIDNVVFYKPVTGASVRTIGYSFDVDGYDTSDISIFSPHFFEGHDIASWAYAQEPRSVIWAVRDDGALLCFTWEKEQQVWGWTLCETDGLFKSVCVISENGEDRLYAVVERVIEGVTQTYIERMASATFTDSADCCFLDSAVSFAFDAPQTTFGNLHHLEGRSVAAVVDGNVVTGLTVSNGSVTLPEFVAPATRATVGLAYDAYIETLPVVMQGRDGSNQGKRSDVGEVVIRVHKTRNIMVGRSLDSLSEVKNRELEAYDASEALFTGDYDQAMEPLTSGEANVVIKSAVPMPMTILGVFLDPVTTG